MHFDFVDLRLLLAVAETGSMSRGAERCCLSPPAVTNRIKHLEESFGVRLFHRTNLGVTPTPAGEAFVRHGRALLAEVGRLHDDLAAFGKGMRGLLRLWVNTTALGSDLPETLAAYMASHPDVKVELRERMSSDILRAVDEGMADIGIVAGALPPGKLTSVAYREDRLVVVTPLGHDLAGRGAVDFAETLMYDHVNLSDSSALHQFVSQAAMVCGGRLNLRIEVGSFEAVCRIVAAGSGVGVIPAAAARRCAQAMQIAVTPLSNAWARRDLSVCVRGDEPLPSFGRDLMAMLACRPADAATLSAGQGGVPESEIDARAVPTYSFPL